MLQEPNPVAPENMQLLVDIPIRLFTAIRTQRFYPPANPQVQLSKKLLLDSLQEGRQATGKQDIDIAMADGCILVASVRLGERDLARQQIRGLINFYTQFNIHSITFHSDFSDEDCSTILTLLSDFMGTRDSGESLGALVAESGLSSVAIDSKRYVEVHGVPGATGTGQYVLAVDGSEESPSPEGKRERVAALQSISRELVEELTGLPLGNDLDKQNSEELFEAILEILFNLDLEESSIGRNAHVEESSVTLGNLPSSVLAGLFPQMPETPVGDAVLSSTLQQLSPGEIDKIIMHLETQAAADDAMTSIQAKNVLKRLDSQEESAGIGVRESLALHRDASELLACVREGDMPTLPLQQRLQHAKWASSVLVSAAQQSMEGGTANSFALFDQTLRFFGNELSDEQRNEVIGLAATKMAQLDAPALSSLLAHKFQGLFGEQLYDEILQQVSDVLLDQTIEHLTPKQLNRMVAVLISDIPLQVGKDQLDDLIEADKALFKKLAKGRMASKLKAEITSQLDTAALQEPIQSISDLPDSLRSRMGEPKWPARLLATSLQRTIDPQNFEKGKANFSSHEAMLKRYSLLFDKDNLRQIAVEAGSLIAAMEDEDLELVLMRPETTAFGEQIKEELVNKINAVQAERISLRLMKKSERHIAPPLEMDEPAVQEAYKKVQEQLQKEKIEAIIHSHRERKRKRQEDQIRRIKGGLDGLLLGETETLLLKEVMIGAPEALRTYIREEQPETADSLLKQIAIGLRDENPDIQNNAASALSACAAVLADEGQWQRLNKLLPAMKLALRTPGLKIEEMQHIISTISSLSMHHLKEQRFSQAASGFQLLQALSETPEEENYHLHTLVLRTRDELKKFATPEVLEMLLDLYLHSDEDSKDAGKLLNCLGIESARYQIQQLLQSESRAERTHLLRLIEHGGKTALSALMEQLSMDAPWFVTRSIIRLLGELGNSPLFTVLQPFLCHTDIRVQQEVLRTGTKIGGEHYKSFLVNALRTVDKSLQAEVIERIVEMHDDRFVRPLFEMMQDETILAAEHRDELQINIVHALEQIGTKRALNLLTTISEETKGPAHDLLSDAVRQAATDAVEHLHQKGPSPSSSFLLLESEDQPQVEDASPLPSPSYSPEEEEFFSLLAQGESDKAKGLMLGLVSAAARSGDFAKADTLKQHLYAVEGLALREIIQAEELIEQAKHNLIPQEDLKIWDSLNNELSTQEFQTIYHEFEKRTYSGDELLVKQGESNDHLFFINQGSVKVSYADGPKEIFVTTLNRGHVAGENFFTPSVWTVSLTALIKVQAYLLPRSSVLAWEERFPGLKEKLQHYYNTFDNTWSILAKKKLERRKHERADLSRKILVQPLNPQGTPIGRGFRAEVLDISAGGMAFLIRIGKQENARILLGRHMQIVFPVNGNTPYQYIPGIILGVQPYQLLDSDFSVHFRFDQVLEPEALQAILR